MRKYFLSLVVAAPFVATAAYGLPAPSSPSSREKRAVAPRATPTPVAQRRAVAVSEADRPSTVVVIDAGHGGFDRGGIPRQLVPEKTMNLDVAQRLKAVLTAYGYRVVMTRDSDVFVPLGTRVAIANSYRDAIFVCIHFNAARRRSASGIETYFYSSQSLPLASAIHYYVAGGAPSSNRGVRRRGFYVLRRTTIPSVLVECGFLTNAAEANYAQSADYRRSSRSSIRPIIAIRTFRVPSAVKEAPRVRLDRHRRSASILPIQIRRKRRQKGNRPPPKRRINWNRPC